ncbi:MAG: serine/threonine protein kinase [Lachnospiraceae bacterium]|nr:serine/threonine protein kinase [Lachnospiraceae bacterium]
MTKTELIDMLDEYKAGLLLKATNGTIDDKYYIQTRKCLLENIDIKERIPQFIKSCRTADEFRRYMQNESENYAGRRKLITDSINTLIEYIEEHFDEEIDPFLQIKQYKRLEQIGSGGFGCVFKYHNDCLDMDFAVKVYSPIFVSSDEQKDGERRFFREAKMLFQLNHMNIVKIYDAGRIFEGPFIRMEYIEGYDLIGLQKKYGMLSFEDSVKVVRPILNGLEYAHGKGIIHRDLKPSNVVFSTKERLFKIIDFGVSAFLDTDNHTKLTQTGEAVAGGVFIDPLLQENPKLRDCRSDIYSIGAIWYWLLCGRAPHGSDMKAYLGNAASYLSDEQIDVVMKCLAGDLEDRYGNCSELLAVIS